LRHKTDGRLDTDLENIFKQIFINSRNLIRIAEEFLQKFQSRNPVLMYPQHTDLREDVVDPILEELKEDLQKNHIDLDNRLSLSPPAQQIVRGDRVALKSVFRNLLHNAINHGGYGCTLSLEVDEAPTYLRLRVQNNGETHYPELQPEKCTEVQEGWGNGQGVGLGLSLGREVMQSQGGDILFESCRQGAQFIMTLPRAALTK
jgi:signal transduction histidine kinase